MLFHEFGFLHNVAIHKLIRFDGRRGAQYILCNRTHLEVGTGCRSDNKFVGLSLLFCQSTQGWIR